MTADAPDAGAAARLIGSLGAVARLRIAAAVVLGAGTAGEVRTATGLEARTVHRELERLVAAGVIAATDPDGRFEARVEDLAAAARELAKAGAAQPPRGPPVTAEEKVRRAFFKDGRLTSIPAQRQKRLVILDVLAQEFEPGRRYPEREVNRRLRGWHDDVAALRRYLVDEGFMERELGEYWRSGGSFDIEG
jgi:hypothetical protein